MIILASQSPRRHELMKLTGLPFTVRVADIDETMDPALPVQQEVTRVSRRKAQAIAAGASPDDIVIAADTIVGASWESRARRKKRSVCSACSPAERTRS